MLITYHSASGNTDKMAHGVAEGAKTIAGTKVVLKRVGEVTADDLLSSDAVIVGSSSLLWKYVGRGQDIFRQLEPQVQALPGTQDE